MALARRATTPQRAFAALRFYTRGYKDNHLAVWNPSKSAVVTTWAGWAVERQGGRYRVSGRAAHWPVDTPQVREQVLSCDGRPLDDLLADKVAPFVTRLTHLESTKSHLAWHLTHESPAAPLWEPLRVSRCTTRTATGEIRHYGMEWQPLTDKDSLALETINAILSDGDQGELLIVLRQLAQAFGGVQAVAEQAQLNPTQLYRTLSLQGNPALSSLTAILKAMGLRLAVQPLPTPQPSHPG